MGDSAGGSRRQATGAARGRPAKKGKLKPRHPLNRGAEGESAGLSYGNGKVGPGANTGPWIEVDANGAPISTAPERVAVLVVLQCTVRLKDCSTDVVCLRVSQYM